MKILTEKFSYGFIIFSVIFGASEVCDKLVYNIPNFSNVEIFGIGIIVILSVLLLLWELNKAVLSHYPAFLRLDDLGGDFYGLSSGHTGQNGNLTESTMIIMIRRRGKRKDLVRPKQLIIRIRAQFEVIFVGGGGIILNDDPLNSDEKEGFKNWHYGFTDSNMEESSLGYSFKIRHPKNTVASNMPLEMYAIPNCRIKLNYDFGFFKRISFKASEIVDIQHG